MGISCEVIKAAIETAQEAKVANELVKVTFKTSKNALISRYSTDIFSSKQIDIFNQVFNGKLQTALSTIKEEIKEFPDIYKPIVNQLEAIGGKKLSNLKIFKDIIEDTTLDDVTRAEKIKDTVLALRTIFDTQMSYRDINHSKKVFTIDGIIDPETGLYNMDAVNLQQVIGMNIAKSKGIATTNTDSDNRAKLYQALGTPIVAYLVQQKILKADTGAFIYNHQYGTTNDVSAPLVKSHAREQKLSDKQILTLSIENLLGISKDQVNTHKVEAVVFSRSLGDKFKKDDLAIIKNASRLLSKLVMPGNVIAPLNEPLGTLEEFKQVLGEHSDLNIFSKKKIELLYHIHKQPKYINPIFIPFLQQLEKEVISGSYTIREAVFNLAEGDPDIVKEILGLVKVEDDIPSITNSTTGKERTSYNNLMNLIYNLDKFVDKDGSPKPMFFTPYDIKTDRVFYYENVLNVQGDKRLSRQLLVSTNPIDYKTDTKGIYNIDVYKEGTKQYTDEFKNVLAFLVDSKVKPFVIKAIIDAALKGDSKSPYLKALEDTNILTVKTLPKMDALIAKGMNLSEPTLFTKPNMNVFEKYKVIKMLRDLAAIKDNQMITYSETAQDATASGIFIKALLNIPNKAVQNLFGKMGFPIFAEKDSNGVYKSEYNDFYHIIQKKISEQLNSNASSGESLSLNEKLIKEEENIAVDTEYLTNVLEALKELGISERDFVKAPVMTTGGYAQGIEGASIASIHDIVDNIVLSLYNLNKTNPARAEVVLNNLLNFKEGSEEYIPRKDIHKFLVTEVTSDAAGPVDLLKQKLVPKIGTYLAKSASKYIADAMFKDYHNKLDVVFKNVVQYIKDHYKGDMSLLALLPPSVLLDEGFKAEKFGKGNKLSFIKKHGIPLTKTREVITDDQNTVLKDIENVYSLYVSAIHSLDNYIQIFSIGDTIEELTKEYGSEVANAYGLSMMHDSASAHSRFNTKNSKHYFSRALEATKNYDILDSLFMTAEALGMPIDDIADLKKIKDENDVAIAEKVKIISEYTNSKQYQEDLDNTLSFNFYGYQQKDVDAVSKAKPDVSKKETTTEESKKQDTPKKAKEKETEESLLKGLEEFSFGAGIEAIAGVFDKSKLANLSTEYKEMYREALNFIKDNGLRLVENSNKFFTFSIDKKDNSEVITLGNTETAERYVEYLKHEVQHAKSAAFIFNNPNDADVKYLNENIEDIIDQLGIDIGNKDESGYILSRLDYALKEGKERGEEFTVAEFVAIMTGEASVRKFINEYLDPKPKNAFARLIEKITNWWNNVKPTEDPLKEHKDKLRGALQAADSLIAKGTEYRKINTYAEELVDDGVGATAKKSFKPNTTFTPSYTQYKGRDISSDPLTAMTTSLNRYIVDVAISRVEMYGKTITDSLLKKEHDKLYKSNGFYKDVVDVLSDINNSQFVSSMKDYLNIGEFKDRKLRGDLISLVHNLTGERNKITSTHIKELDDLLKLTFKNEKGSPDKQFIAKLDKIYSRTGIGYLFNDDNDYNELVDGKVSLEELIKKYESKLSKLDQIHAKELAVIYLEGKRGATYNFDNVSTEAAVKQISLNRLISLYSLERIPDSVKALKTIKANTDIHGRFTTVVLGIKEMYNKLYKTTGDTPNYRGNMVNDQFESNYDFKIVTKEEQVKGIYTKDERWQVLRSPTKDSLGIIYRTNDYSAQMGVGVDFSYNIDGLIIPNSSEVSKNRLMQNNAVRIITGDSSFDKILLTQEEKETLRLIENPAHSLYRTYAHLQLLVETQHIRDELVSSSFTKVINTKKDAEELEKIIKNKEQDYHWFIKLGENMSFDELPKLIQTKYKSADRITNIGKMNKKIDLVRKDAAYWIQGEKEADVFSNSSLLNRTANVIRKSVLLTKLHWVVTNPFKIAADLISNYAYLATVGVPYQNIYKYSVEAVNELKELERLRGDVVGYKLLVASEPTNEAYKKKLEEVQTKLKNHPLAFAHYNGLIQSLSTDIILKDFDTVSGLQRDIEDILNRIVRENKGKGDLNTLGKFILSTSKKGPRVEDLLDMVSNKASGFKMTGTMGEWLHNTSKNISTIKEEEDVAKYLSQFMATPGSEVTKLGSAAVQYSDVVPRIVLFKHLRDEGKSEEKAIVDVLESFIDYRVNMPKELKIISDYGLLLFPSYWLRIQKIIVNLLRERPGSFALSYALTELMGAGSILQQNIFEKSGLLHTPADVLGIDTLLPTKLFG